jgi:DNA-binding NtrC family response regulator
MSAASKLLQPGHWLRDLRIDEDAVRVLMVEASVACASLLHAILRRARRGHFDVVEVAEVGQVLEREVVEGDYDALVIDLERLGTRAEPVLDFASAMAQRLPVVLLTGTADGRLTHPANAAAVANLPIRRRLERADIPATILRAIRRHRRVGAGGAGPVFCRIPGV